MILEVILVMNRHSQVLIRWPEKHRIRNSIPIRSATGDGASVDGDNVILTEKQCFC